MYLGLKATRAGWGRHDDGCEWWRRLRGECDMEVTCAPVVPASYCPPVCDIPAWVFPWPRCFSQFSKTFHWHLHGKWCIRNEFWNWGQQQVCIDSTELLSLPGYVKLSGGHILGFCTRTHSHTHIQACTHTACLSWVPLLRWHPSYIPQLSVVRGCAGDLLGAAVSSFECFNFVTDCCHITGRGRLRASHGAYQKGEADTALIIKVN